MKQWPSHPHFSTQKKYIGGEMTWEHLFKKLFYFGVNGVSIFQGGKIEVTK
jgi:hypothetical protein